MSTHVAEKRPLGALGRMSVVAGLHVGVAYLIATSLGIVPPLIPEKMTGTIIEQQPIIDEPPPVVGPADPERFDVTVPTPEVPPIDFDTPPEVIQGRINDDPTPVPPVVPDVAPALVGVRPDARYPLSQPPYPPSAVRGEQQGSVEIEIYVMPNGRVGDARVIKSTGYPALDQSALDEAKRRWRMQPATRDGVPYAQWHKLRVVFNLKDRDR